jgi:hypothetical protein
MIAYHSLPLTSLPHVLKDGLKCTSRGEKGDDASIAKTDYLLDAHRPAKLIEAHISRDNNLYAYVADNNKIVDITDGSQIGISTFIQQNNQVILEIQIDETKCYVSDLDMFDTVKRAIEEDADQQTLLDLASKYWNSLQPLSTFSVDSIRRPEIMVPYDISPDKIVIINK